VSLHAGLVDGSVSQSDGATVGYNYDQTVGPGESTSMTWWVPTDVGNASVPLVDFGDRVGNRHHGLFGELLIEPPGATWLDPATGAPATGLAAEVRWTEGTTQRSTREFVAMWQDGLTLRSPSGQVLPIAVAAGAPGDRARSLRTETSGDQLPHRAVRATGGGERRTSLGDELGGARGSGDAGVPRLPG
jgi:hypothetical protein